MTFSNADISKSVFSLLLLILLFRYNYFASTSFHFFLLQNWALDVLLWYISHYIHVQSIRLVQIINFRLVFFRIVWRIEFYFTTYFIIFYLQLLTYLRGWFIFAEFHSHTRSHTHAHTHRSVRGKLHSKRIKKRVNNCYHCIIVNNSIKCEPFECEWLTFYWDYEVTNMVKYIYISLN